MTEYLFFNSSINYIVMFLFYIFRLTFILLIVSNIETMCITTCKILLIFSLLSLFTVLHMKMYREFWGFCLICDTPILHPHSPLPHLSKPRQMMLVIHWPYPDIIIIIIIIFLTDGGVFWKLVLFRFWKILLYRINRSLIIKLRQYACKDLWLKG